MTGMIYDYSYRAKLKNQVLTRNAIFQDTVGDNFNSPGAHIGTLKSPKQNEGLVLFHHSPSASTLLHSLRNGYQIRAKCKKGFNSDYCELQGPP